MRAASIICTRNRPEDTRRVLDSMVLQDLPFEQVVIVDASDGEETAEVARTYCSGPLASRVTYTRSPRGLTIQRNAGIALVGEGVDIVCFFDDDVELDASYASRITSFLAKPENGDVLGVCGHATNERRRSLPDRLVRRAFFITDNDSGRLLPSGDAGHVFAPTADTEVATLSGCNMCFRAEVFRRLGLRFDPALAGYAYMEDQDFSVRVARSGRLVQVAEARLVHHVSGTSRPGQRDRFRAYVLNSHYLLKKNLSPNLWTWVAYAWRLVGKLVQAAYESAKSGSPAPMAGWCAGVWALVRSRLAGP